jgi:hypothetical protein
LDKVPTSARLLSATAASCSMVVPSWCRCVCGYVCKMSAEWVVVLLRRRAADDDERGQQSTGELQLSCTRRLASNTRHATQFFWVLLCLFVQTTIHNTHLEGAQRHIHTTVFCQLLLCTKVFLL